MASLRAHAYSYAYMHWSYTLSCIGTRECSQAWRRKGNVYKAGMLMARSKAKKCLEKDPLIWIDFEVLFLHYKFPWATVKGWTLIEIPKVLCINFTKKICLSHEEVSYLLSWNFLKILLPRGNSPTPLTNIVINAVRDVKHNPCLFFLLFSMSC